MRRHDPSDCFFEKLFILKFYKKQSQKKHEMHIHLLCIKYNTCLSRLGSFSGTFTYKVQTVSIVITIFTVIFFSRHEISGTIFWTDSSKRVCKHSVPETRFSRVQRSAHEDSFKLFSAAASTNKSLLAKATIVTCFQKKLMPVACLKIHFYSMHLSSNCCFSPSLKRSFVGSFVWHRAHYLESWGYRFTAITVSSAGPFKTLTQHSAKFFGRYYISSEGNAW